MRKLWRSSYTETKHFINDYAITLVEKEPVFNGEWIDGEFIPIYDELEHLEIIAEEVAPNL